MTRILGPLVLGLASVAVPGAVRAQDVSTGAFIRSFSFDSGIGARRVTQWGVPLAARIAVGRRMTFAISSGWASTELASYDGWTRRFAGLTDAEARVSYVLGRDVAVITLGGNLPIGAAPSTVDRAVTGATASNMIAFPVTRFRSGPAATGALAVARRWGGVNVGFGAGVRWAGSFQPVRDEPSRFSPALEGRLHAAASGLLLGGQLGVSVTGSTFTRDEFGRTAVDAGPARQYRPGLRSVIAAKYLAPLGRQTLGLGAWVFHQGAPRDSAGAETGSPELIMNFSALVAVPIGSSMVVSPRVEFRRGTRDDRGPDRLLSAELGWTVALGARTRLYVSGRYDAGFVSAEATGNAVDVRGTGVTVGISRVR